MGMRYLFLFILLFNFKALCQETSPGFLDGVKAYQEKDFEKAQEIFTPILAEHPENPSLLFNLGLAEYQLGNFGMALGLWRKARFLDQSFAPVSNAIEFTEEKLFPDQQSSSFFIVIFNWLKNRPAHLWLLISFLSLALGGWLTLEYGVKRRLPFSLWPTLIYFAAPLFLFSSVFSSLVVIDESKTKATVIEKNQLTHANPSDTSPTLSELNEGQVVFVEKAHGSWVQVRTFNGSPGWVPQTSLIAFRGK